MTQTIVDGSNKTTQDQYTGPANEITVDESNYDLRLHDGSTPGGHIIQSRDNADQRYQVKSAELAGLNGFAPEDHGWLVRRGPADYRLRQITVNGQQLSITNGDGYAGNPVLGLADVIGTDHQWLGQHIFEDVVQFNSGINADVAGNLTGDVTGNVTGDLTGNSTGSHVGPVDVRGQALLLDDAQIDQAKINGLAAALASISAVIQPGFIVLWSGSAATVPSGWAICDGTGGTPDLRDKFVIGAGHVGDPTQVGAVGGNATHTHTATAANAGGHNHAASSANTAITTAQMPAHRHFIAKSGINNTALGASMPIAGEKDSGGDSGYRLTGAPSQSADIGESELVGANQGHNHAITVTAVGDHTHGLTVQNTTQLPPYYALCYIMRV